MFRLAAVLVLLASSDAKKRRKVKKEIVECGGKEPPPSEEFDVRVVTRIDDDVCDRRSEVGDTLTVKFGSVYYDTCEEFQTNKGVEFVLGSENVLRGWNLGLVGMCEGEVRKLYLSTHELLTQGSKRKAPEERELTERSDGDATAGFPSLAATKTRAVIMTVELQEAHRKRKGRGEGL
jgi:hypothetical protein